MNNVKPAGIRPYTAADDLTDMEGRVLAFTDAKTVGLPTTATSVCLLILATAALAGGTCEAHGLLDGGQARLRLNGTCSAGDKLVVDVTSGNEGKAKALPATPGSYFMLGIAVEDGVDEQLVLIEPLPMLEVVPDAVINAPTFTATSGSLPTAAGSTTFANAATPTVAELLDAVVELRATQAAMITAMKNGGNVATS